jgi:hypothetical protein
MSATARVLAWPGGPVPVARTRIVVPAAPRGPATAPRWLRISAPVSRVAAPDRLLATAAPARPAMAARWLRISVPGIRVAVPERLFATAAPAEQPAQAAAARVGRLRKLL